MHQMKVELALEIIFITADFKGELTLNKGHLVIWGIWAWFNKIEIGIISVT